MYMSVEMKVLIILDHYMDRHMQICVSVYHIILELMRLRQIMCVGHADHHLWVQYNDTEILGW